MHRHGIVNVSANAFVPELCPQPVTSSMSNHVLMVNMSCVRAPLWHHQPCARKTFVVGGGNGCPSPISGIQVRQLHPQDGGLEFVEATIDARDVADVAALPSILPQSTHLLNEFKIIGNDHSTIANCSNIFRWIKTECRNVPHASDEASVKFRPMSLRAVLNDTNAEPVSNLRNGRNVSRMTVEVYRDHRLDGTAFLKCSKERLRVHGVSIRIYIDENWRSA